MNNKFPTQAYDTVWRAGLYAKLESLGFGGRTLQIIKSLYFNDSLRFLLNGKYSDPLWLLRGVKQGTNKRKSNNFSLLKLLQAAIYHLYCSAFM